MTADELPKVYELPGLEPAPASDLQALLRRFIEYADWGAVRPLLDCLNEAGRHEDARAVRRSFGAIWDQQARNRDWACSSSWWESTASDLAALFAFDLYAPEACVAIMQPVRLEEGEMSGDYAVVASTAVSAPARAEGDIPNGALVAWDYATNTVRVHPAPVPVTPTEGE